MLWGIDGTPKPLDVGVTPTGWRSCGSFSGYLRRIRRLIYHS